MKIKTRTVGTRFIFKEDGTFESTPIQETYIEHSLFRRLFTYHNVILTVLIVINFIITFYWYKKGNFSMSLFPCFCAGFTSFVLLDNIIKTILKR